MVQQYNVTLEREITNSLALSVGYVGTRADNINAVLTNAGFNDPNLRNRLTTVANVGDSNYNSLQVKATLRPYQGFNFLASYTFGKAINNTPGPFPGPGGNFRTAATDANNLDADKGLADFVRNRFTFAANYELAFFRNSQGLTKALFHGFQLNTIVTLQDGTPFSVFGGFNRASVVASPEGDETVTRYFNTAAFRPSTGPANEYEKYSARTWSERG